LAEIDDALCERRANARKGLEFLDSGGVQVDEQKKEYRESTHNVCFRQSCIKGSCGQKV
jgi:hypothetical protein